MKALERARLVAGAPDPSPGTAPPARMRRPSAWGFVLLVAVGALVVHGYGAGAKIDPTTLGDGAGRLVEFLAESVPPDTSRLEAILRSLLLTFEMAVVGTIAGVALSIPIAIGAARNTTPHRVVYASTRALISLCRTIPDLVWGLIFVVAVGLGPQAGVLAIAVDVMGFCGRFFAESIEEVEPGVIDGVRSTGANERSILAGAVLPTCLPAFVATSMFALEASTRSSVVLGLVGAGGIGIELAVSMQLLRYDEALTIILSIFVVVLLVERVSSSLRRRLI